MAAFSYIALDRAGKKVSGNIPADNRAAAMDAVLSLGLSPIKLDEAAGKPAGGGSRASGKAVEADALSKVPGKALESFTRELANLLAAGLSLSRALSLLKREVSQPVAKAVWTKINDDVIGGESLADSMAKYPRTFSTVYIAMVRAGEQGGFLPIVLQQITDFRQREAELKSKVKTAMIYPIALACVATCVLIFLLTFFIPRFTTIFAQFGSKLPLLTQVVVAISDRLISWGPFVAVALFFGVMAFRKWKATPHGRRAVERVLLKTPALNVAIARFALVRFTRMLGTLVGAGVPLIASLRTAKEALGNETLADSVGEAIGEVQRGTALSKALSSNAQLFPASVIEMISVAEETGRLDKELVRLSVSYETDLDRTLKVVVAIAEPLMLVIMAAIIGTVVVAMLLPVFSLQDMIN